METKKESRLDYGDQPENVLYRIQRGLIGYVGYLAACEMNQAFSEYVLYEPMLRIMSAAGYTVECEVVCPNVVQPAGRGDKKKLDFVARRPEVIFAIEAKWTDTQKVDVESDIQKLVGFKKIRPHRSFLCVFGTHDTIEGDRLRLDYDDAMLEGFGFKEFLEPLFAFLVATQYGCRIFEVG